MNEYLFDRYLGGRLMAEQIMVKAESIGTARHKAKKLQKPDNDDAELRLKSVTSIKNE